MPIQTEKNRPDIIVKDKEEKNPSAYRHVRLHRKKHPLKTPGKLSKYKNLEINERMWGSTSGHRCSWPSSRKAWKGTQAKSRGTSE